MKRMSDCSHVFEERYPVDMPLLDYNTMRKSADNFLESNISPLTYSFIDQDGEKLKVTRDNVGRLSLFGDNNPTHMVLALHRPKDQTQVVALYLDGKWWAVNDILKTTNTSRSGLILVQSPGERVALFVLSQIVFGILERPTEDETYFAPHPEKETGKIIWVDREAVGFYTVKEKGSLCDSYTCQSYLLPVLDTVFVRRRWRRRGFALCMLEDFCSSFSKEEALGISWPVSASMYQVCRKYLMTHKEQRDRLYEVEAPGGCGQRQNIWLHIQLSGSPSNT